MIQELFEHARETLSIQQLEKISNLVNSAELDAENIGTTLNTIATLMASDDKLNKPSDSELAAILWGLSYRANYVRELIAVSRDARFFLGQRQAEKTD